jgi:MOSC domain-containing protein YiiM
LINSSVSIPVIDPTCLESAAAPGGPPRLLAICSAQPEPLWPANDSIARNAVLSAIRKRAISTLADPVTVQVGPLGVAGDAQADRAVHGGRNQAVYAYPFEHYAFWSSVRGQARQPTALTWGAMGENFVLQGLLESALWVGDRLRIGTLEFLVTRPRTPCFKFDHVMGFRQASKMMVQSGYTGFYLAVQGTGHIAAGDAVEVLLGERMISLAQRHALAQHKGQGSLW